MLRISKLNNGQAWQPNTNTRLKTVGETNAPNECDQRTYHIRDKFRIFLKSGAKNVEKNQAYNESRIHEDLVWVSFCAPFFHQEYKLSDIDCSVAATYKAFHRWGKEPLTKRALAKQIGISTSTLHLAEKRLRDLEILIHDKNMVSTYHNTNRKAFRWVYKWNPFCESGLKKFKNQIESLKRYNLLKQKRTIPQGVQSHTSCNGNKKLSSPSHRYVGCWWEYRQHFTKPSPENLKTTIYHSLKWAIRLPKPEQLHEAIKRGAGIAFLKQAHWIGWKEASKSRLIARGGEINDNSKTWEKYQHNGLSFLWFLKHWSDVLEGKYDDRALNDKAKRIWEDHAKKPLPRVDAVDTKRPETSCDDIKQPIMDKPITDAERDLRIRLLDKHGPYVYENWFQACGYDAESGNLTHDSDFYRNEIERKYGAVVI